MTAIDLLIVAVGTFVGFRIYKNRDWTLIARNLPSQGLIAAGLLVIVMFFLADLYVMWVMPRFAGMKAAMSAMENLHLNISWFMIPLAIIGIAIGLLRMNEILNTALDSTVKTEERFRGAFENAGVGIVIRSADGKNREHNRAFCDMMGYSAEELQSLRLRDLAHPDDNLETTSLRYISFGDTDNKIIERRFIRKDGKVIWCNISYKSVYDADLQPLSTITIYQDTTERKEGLPAPGVWPGF